jgi:integrase
VVVTGVRRGELYGLQIRDADLDRGLVHVAFNYVVGGGQRVRNDTKTHQGRWLAIDPGHMRADRGLSGRDQGRAGRCQRRAARGRVPVLQRPSHSRPRKPDWATHKAADAARVKLDIRGRCQRS